MRRRRGTFICQRTCTTEIGLCGDSSSRARESGPNLHSTATPLPTHFCPLRLRDSLPFGSVFSKRSNVVTSSGRRIRSRNDPAVDCPALDLFSPTTSAGVPFKRLRAGITPGDTAVPIAATAVRRSDRRVISLGCCASRFTLASDCRCYIVMCVVKTRGRILPPHSTLIQFPGRSANRIRHLLTF